MEETKTTQTQVTNEQIMETLKLHTQALELITNGICSLIAYNKEISDVEVAIATTALNMMVERLSKASGVNKEFYNNKEEFKKIMKDILDIIS